MEIILGILLVVAALTVYLLFSHYSSSHHPPGPTPLPVVGNFSRIDFLRPHQSIHELSHKYGPIMQLYFGSVPVVVGSSVEMAKQFLKVHDLKFASRPKSHVGFYNNYDHTTMVWSPHGPHWSKVRKIFASLFNSKRIQSYGYIRNEESHVFLSLLHASRGKSITIKDNFFDLFFTIFTRMILGRKFIGESASELKSMLDEWFFLNGALHYGDYVPWVRFLDFQGNLKRMKALQKKMDSFLEQQVNEHLVRRKDPMKNASIPNDMLDVLLHSADTFKLSHNNVKSITWEILAGISTTTIEWAMSEMLRRTDTFEHAIEELDRVVGRDRHVEEKDLADLVYIKHVLYETMRMHPVSPLLTPHFARENCKVNGYEIRQGSQILVNVWSIGRDPKVWDAPNEFHPERFRGRDIDVINGQHFELLPFGSGRRMCPASGLGLQLTMLAFANTLHGFTFKLGNAVEPENLNMEEEWGLTVARKIPLLVVAEPRLPLHVYST